MPELLDYQGPMARLVMQPHPFSIEREECVLYPGTTIASMHEQLGYHGSHARVWIDGRFVPEAKWLEVSPGAGQLVTMKIIPQGGGGGGGGTKDVLRIVAMVGVLALAIAAPYIAAALVPALGSIVGATTIGGALLTAGVVFVGSLKACSLIPPPSSSRLIGDNR